MMRYSFSDFLNYQNELNNKYDQKVVDVMIDGVLTALRQYIEVHPTTHTYVATGYDIIENNRTMAYKVFSCCHTLKELKAVKKYLENMGFSVEYLRNAASYESPFNDSVNGIQGFILTW